MNNLWTTTAFEQLPLFWVPKVVAVTTHRFVEPLKVIGKSNLWKFSFLAFWRDTYDIIFWTLRPGGWGGGWKDGPILNSSQNCLPKFEISTFIYNKVMYSFTDSTPVYGESGCNYYTYFSDPNVTATSVDITSLDGYVAGTGQTCYFSITSVYDAGKSPGNTISMVFPYDGTL